MRIELLLVVLIFMISHPGVGVDAIVEKEEVSIEVISLKNFKIHKKQRVQILTPEGDKFARLSYAEDEFIRNREFVVRVYDASGDLVDTFTKNVFERELLFKGANYYDDAQVYSLDVSRQNHPYTLEISSITHREWMFDFSWNPISSESVFYKELSLTISRPADLELEIYTNSRIQHTASLEKKVRSDFFKLGGSLGIKKEPFGLKKSGSLVELIFKNFDYNGYRGSLESWESFGLWMNELWRKKSNLNEKALAEIYPDGFQNLNDSAKAKLAFDCIKKNMRYVAITYGIGGLQTASAQKTFQSGYGDCKALTNLMCSILDMVDVESYPALISAGKNDAWIDPNRPTHNFNHVILCVPNQGDTIWVECTSQNAPLNYLSDFTDNRFALLLTPEGGKLVKTPSYFYHENLASRNTTLSISSTGEVEIFFEAEYERLAMERSVFQLKNAGYQDEGLIRYFTNLKSFEVENLEVEEYASDNPRMTVSLRIHDRLFTKKMGKKLLFTPFFYTGQFPAFEEEERTEPIYFRRGYTYVDTIDVIFPTRMTLDKFPESRSVETDFGGYQLETNLLSEAEGVRFVRKVYYKEGEYPKENYSEIKGFFDTIKKDESIKLALIPKS